MRSEEHQSGSVMLKLTKIKKISSKENCKNNVMYPLKKILITLIRSLGYLIFAKKLYK